MAWDNKTENAGSESTGSDYLTVAPGAVEKVRILLFDTQEPATYGTFKVEYKDALGVEKVMSFTSFPGCKLENNREQAKFAFRNVVSVWHYASQSVKKFGFGNKLKDQLKALHFSSGHLGNYDVNISRVGEKRETTWFAAPVMGSVPALPPEFNIGMITWDIYNLPEFALCGEEEIIRQFAEVGINYDEFTRPRVYTLEEAMAFKLPFSKHKGLTLGEVFSIDTGWIVWAANNAKMVDLKNMCVTIQRQLIAGGTMSAPPARQVAPTVPVAPPALPPVQQTQVPVSAPIAPVAPPVQAVAPVVPPVAPQAPVAPPSNTGTAVSYTAPTAPAPVGMTANTVSYTAPVQPATGVNREVMLASIDGAIRANPEFANYQRVVEVMREVTSPTPNFDLRTYSDEQLNLLLTKVQPK